MSAQRSRVLVVDDDPTLCKLLDVALTAKGFEVELRHAADDALAAVRDRDVDAVLTDLNMPGMNGLEFCERIAANHRDLPVIVMTAHASMETAIAALRVGAEDYVTKPLQMEALAIRLQRAVTGRRLRQEVKRLRRAAEHADRYDDLVGDSPAMHRVYDLIERVVNSDASVLITGDSGTGKELVARALHRRGRRADGPFVALNCSAVPTHLLESELFGHTRGAFTDARGPRTGLFVQASTGTLFLDEIGDMPVALQPKLLRALQERLVRPVGSNEEQPVDVRIIAATNRDLETAVADGAFREDLFFRINVIHVELPPLRARGRDVLTLAQHFLARFAAEARKPVAKLSPQTAERLLAYHWPGNVRELQNCIEHAVALARFDEIAVDDLPEKVRAYQASHVLVVSDDPAELVPMEQVERRYIERVMQAVGGNKTMAAKVLGFDRKRLYRKLERYGLS